MIRSKSLVSAQKLFTDLTQGNVNAHYVESNVNEMRFWLAQARKDGQPDLSIRDLDVTGKKSIEEAEAAIVGLLRDAALEVGVSHAREILSGVHKLEGRDNASLYCVYEEVESTLRDAGANTDIFTRGHQPALSEIDALLEGYEKDIAAKKAGVVKTGQAR